MALSPQQQKTGSFQFSPQNLDKAKKIIAKYPPLRQASALLPLLDLAQRQNDNWVSQGVIDYLAGFLDMPPMRVLEVASFYTMFNLQPVGKHHVQVCTTTPCWLSGSDEIMEACESHLGIGLKQTTKDGSFTLSEMECLGACVNAPVVQINDDYYEDLTPQQTVAILKDLAAGKKPSVGSQTGRQGSKPQEASAKTASKPSGKTKEELNKKPDTKSRSTAAKIGRQANSNSKKKK